MCSCDASSPLTTQMIMQDICNFTRKCMERNASEVSCSVPLARSALEEKFKMARGIAAGGNMDEECPRRGRGSAPPAPHSVCAPATTGDPHALPAVIFSIRLASSDSLLSLRHSQVACCDESGKGCLLSLGECSPGREAQEDRDARGLLRVRYGDQRPSERHAP